MTLWALVWFALGYASCIASLFALGAVVQAVNDAEHREKVERNKRTYGEG